MTQPAAGTASRTVFSTDSPVATSTPVVAAHCPRALFERSTLGVVQTDLARRVVYANPAAMDMLGADAYLGLTLDEVFKPEARAELDTQLQARHAGVLGIWRTDLSRLSDGKGVPVDITGIPLVDDGGSVVGALGIFRSIEKERVTSDLRELTRNLSGKTELLTAVARRLQQAIPFTVMVVSRYSADLSEADSYFMFGGPVERVPKVWYAITQEQVDWQRDHPCGVMDFKDVMDNPPWSEMRDEPMVQQLIEAGVQKTMWRAIKRAGHPVASISLMSSDCDAFAQEAQDLFADVPLDEAVLRAIDCDRQRMDDKKFALLRALNREATVHTACKLLAGELVRMFGWSHVFVFRVDRGAGAVRLMDYASGPADAHTQVDRDYLRPADQGILGQVVQEERAVNVGKVAVPPEYILGAAAAAVRSQLACPIAFAGEPGVRYVVCADDVRENAFSREDVAVLQDIANEISGVMQRISQAHFLTQCFESASDPIIITYANLAIRRLNPAAASMVGLPDASELTCGVQDLFADPALFQQRLAEQVSGDLGELELRHHDANEVRRVPVHVTRQEIRESLGGFVFVARDLRQIRRAVEVDLLEKAAYEVAVETRTPLSLALTQLERLACRLPEPEQQDVEKVLRQLSRVKHAYGRLAMFNLQARTPRRDFRPLNLREEIEVLLGELTGEERARVKYAPSEVPPPVLGDHHQVGVVFESLLSMLVRAAPEAVPVTVTLAHDNDTVFVRLAGKMPLREVAPERRRRMYEADSELHIANPLLVDIMQAHHGALAVRTAPDGTREFTLRFPAGGQP